MISRFSHPKDIDPSDLIFLDCERPYCNGAENKDVVEICLIDGYGVPKLVTNFKSKTPLTTNLERKGLPRSLLENATLFETNHNLIDEIIKSKSIVGGAKDRYRHIGLYEAVERSPIQEIVTQNRHRAWKDAEMMRRLWFFMNDIPEVTRLPDFQLNYDKKVSTYEPLTLR